MKTKQDLFMEWLANRVPSSSLSDYYFAVTEIESFAHKKKVFSGSLFDVSDSTVSGKLVSAINADKIFRFKHKKQMKTIVDLSQLFHKYIRESENTAKAPANNAAEKSIAPSIEDLPVTHADNVDSTTSIMIQEPDAIPPVPDVELDESDRTGNGQPLIVSGTANQEMAPLSCSETAPHGSTVSEGTGPNIATDTGNTAADQILAFLNNMEIQYIDNRAKEGRLWMLGDMSLKEAAAWLRKNGYSFVYCYRGSKSTGWKSAWYLDEGRKASVKAEADNPEQQKENLQPDMRSEVESKLAPEVSQLLSGDDMQLLREELEKQSILTLERIKAMNLWAFMNRYALYNISQRLDIYKRVLDRLNSLNAVDRDNQYKLETRTAVYYGDSPAEAFARFCEDIAQKYPLKIRSLLGARYNGQGSVVLSRDDSKGDGIKMMSPEAYINRDMTAQAAVVYGQWICKMCGDNNPPIQIVEPAMVHADKVEAPTGQQLNEAETESSVEGSRTSEVPSEKPTSQQEDKSSDNISKAAQIVLKADLDGMTIEELCEELHTTMVATRKIVSSAKHIVQLGEKLVHDEAFVDWEDGADQIEKILDKLLDRNGGYVSAAQFYEFAHSEMQMFLNDNDMDDARLVYDMAQHLFEKVDYHGKHLVFQSKSHISRSEAAVTNVMDLMRNFAKSQGGVFSESDLVQYLHSVGVKTGNLRGLMKVYTHPVFMFYDKGLFILGDSMKIDQEWFSTVSKALKNLFDDMGDHMVFRDIQPWWFAQLPSLPAGRPWTHLLLQSVLQHYSEQVGGAHTINAMSGQSVDTIHAMLVSKSSEIQSFPDAVVAFLVDERVEQCEFKAEELRQLLVQRGLIAGSELIWNMPKALANDSRFAWDASGQKVTIKV